MRKLNQESFAKFKKFSQEGVKVISWINTLHDAYNLDALYQDLRNAQSPGVKIAFLESQYPVVVLYVGEAQNEDEIYAAIERESVV